MYSNLKNKTVYICTLGCKVNQYESDAMLQILQENGCVKCADDEIADIYIINTCSVTNMADKKSRQIIHRMRRKNPNAVIVGTGCYIQATGDELLSDGTVDLIIGNNRKIDAPRIISEYLDSGSPSDYFVDVNKDPDFENLSIIMPENHTRAYIKIQDGCNNFCTYCIIPYVRGRIKSKKLSDIIAEATTLSQNGVKEIILTGINVSSYSDGENTLIDVIEKISEIDGIKRIRMSSVEPRVITDEFLERTSKIESFCPHFHLSLQSACNNTLKAMNRHYTIEEYMETCRKLRETYDRPAITTDIIVGFPGETDEDFNTTLSNLEKLKLYEIHTFKYSRRKGTVADKMPNQVPEDIKNLRSDKVLALTAAQKKEFEEQFKYESQEVLIEEIITKDNQKYYRGHTTRYVVVDIPTQDLLSSDENEEKYINEIIRSQRSIL